VRARARPTIESDSAFLITGTSRPLESSTATAMPRFTERLTIASSPTISAFTHGHLPIASTVAFMMNGRYVRLTPWRALKSAFRACRCATTADMSISMIVVSCAVVRIDSIMCFAIARRMVENL